MTLLSDQPGRAQHQLLTCAQMGRADQVAIAQGVAGTTLMANAGRAVGEAALEMCRPGDRVLVLCGPGNNGGDGFVAAGHLADRGRDVVVRLLGDVASLSGDAAWAAGQWFGDIEPFSPELPPATALVIDAVFGAGLSRPIEASGEIARLFRAIRDRGLQVLAVDVPSGLNGDSGEALGAVLQATRTVTFYRRKPGHLLLPGRGLCGEVKVADIAIPDDVAGRAEVIGEAGRTFANAPALWLDQFPVLEADGHKYTRGHAVVVSGGIEMSGAARLAARAALRAGAGLVTIAAPPDAASAHAAQFSSTLLSITASVADLQQLLGDTRKNAVVIGPGLGIGETARGMLLEALNTRAALVLDADALTIAASFDDDFFSEMAGISGRPVVLTPHEGEFKRLFGGLAGSKLERARHAAKICGAVIVCKGPDTVIAAPDGDAAINENAPPWLATAGSGDVLAGMIGGLLAQHMPPFEAAAAAVWLHGRAATKLGRGLISEDIPEVLPALFREIGV